MRRRLLGSALILAGCLVLIVEIRSLDNVVATLSWNRGIHLSDVLGLLIVLAGIAVIWRE
jgi:hypothetical protein